MNSYSLNSFRTLAQHALYMLNSITRNNDRSMGHSSGAAAAAAAVHDEDDPMTNIIILASITMLDIITTATHF